MSELHQSIRRMKKESEKKAKEDKELAI